MSGEQNVGGTPKQPKPAGAMAEYRVLLPVDIEGRTYQYGETVELDAATAKAYAHALVRVEAAATAKEMAGRGPAPQNTEGK